MADEARDQIVEYFDAFRQQRDRILEEQMTASYDAYKGRYNSAVLKRWKKLEGYEWRSRVFVRATKMKCVAWRSTVDDIYFQSGGIPWDLEPTPYAEAARGMPLPQEIARERCDNMKMLIDDSLTEAKGDRVIRQSFVELPIYGWSWLKGPILRKIKRLRYNFDVPGNSLQLKYPPEMLMQYGRHMPQIEEYMAPVIETPSVWWVFWDLEDENPQTGQGIVDRRWYSEGMLAQLKDKKGYDSGKIDELIKKYGKKKRGKRGLAGGGDPWRENVPDINRVFAIGEWYGRIDAKYVKEEDKKDFMQGNEIEVVATFGAIGESKDAKDFVLIKPPKINRMPMQLRPLWMAQCEEGPHEPAGVGVAENIRDSQEMINSMTRIFIDNLALSSNVISIRKADALAPGEDMGLYPGAEKFVSENVDDVRKAIMFAEIPNVGAQLLPGLNLFERYMDEESNIPRILQGETARFNPKTAYEMSQLLQAANKAIGTSIKNIDDNQLERVIEAYYWYFMDTSDDEEIKGDFNCKAGGFNSFTETIDKGNRAAQVLTFALSNQLILLATNIEPVYRDFLKSRGYDPKDVMKTEEQIKQTLAAMENLQAGMGGTPQEEEIPSPGAPGEAQYSV
jgi:hypothetical protein